ncbi:hypothetical protein L2E82_12328 [Cichorium intybus]|uniref:Uncharacterized protein n=1 Tax=Cichorium intybus TaxID=13427 RepID=A0ACB9GFM0_CICIN|nr:hypothetical protein L2E82_12328 [Cichorium intybus]
MEETKEISREFQRAREAAGESKEEEEIKGIVKENQERNWNCAQIATDQEPAQALGAARPGSRRGAPRRVTKGRQNEQTEWADLFCKGARVAVGTVIVHLMGDRRQADRGEGSHTSSRGSEPHVLRNDEAEPNPPPPQPVTMEAIQFLINNLRTELRQDVHNIIDSRMGEPSAQSSQEFSKKTTEEEATGGNKKEEKGCSFKSFMACKPPEYHGSFEPKVTMRWVREIEQVMQASKCGENDRVNYASRQVCFMS